jgi:hypothetical protein
MTTDNQIDVYCQNIEQTSLKQIADAWNVVCSEKEHYEKCINKFSDKRDMCLRASGCVSEDKLEIPSFDYIAEHLKSQKFANGLSNEEEFDILTQDLYLSLTDSVNHNLKTTKESEALSNNQKSELRSSESKLSNAEMWINIRAKELRELDISLGIEALLLFGAFVVGAIGGVWGALVAVVAMFWWRSNAY